MKSISSFPIRSIVILAAAIGWDAIGADSVSSGSKSSTNRQFVVMKRSAMLGTNQQNRAFFTAPPPVNHFWNTENDSRSCLQCHAKEFRIEKRHKPIRPVPHAEYTQCLQCHVRGNRKDLKPFVESTFVGLAKPGKGRRAHSKAPPTIPHRIFMRDNCLACHGEIGGYTDIRTTHPYRSQCTQCHVQEKQEVDIERK